MAGLLMIEEAGGSVSRFDGTPVGTRADEVIATNGHLHGRLLELLGRSRP
jgi:myo-inositol-1(or 4)-monophosphatase